jgi:FYVE/RhoGEF/PH domain-containing protein 5/6
MLERSGEGRQREFLLFSDCLLWLESENATRVSVDITNNGRNTPANGNGVKRPMVFRTRSKSEAELSALRARFAASAPSGVSSDLPSSGAAPRASTRAANITTPTSSSPPPSPPGSAPANVLRQASSVPSSSQNSGEEKWVFKGKAELVDLEVVVVGGAGEAHERRFEILSPEGSFALYAGVYFLPSGLKLRTNSGWMYSIAR